MDDVEGRVVNVKVSRNQQVRSVFGRKRVQNFFLIRRLYSSEEESSSRTLLFVLWL